MKIGADIVEKGRRLLGGKALTKKRLEKLLDEVEQARLAKEASANPNATVDAPPGLIYFRKEDGALPSNPIPDVRMADIPDAAYVPARLPDPNEDEDDEADDLSIVPPIQTSLDAAGEKSAADQKMEVLMATIAQMQAKIEDLEKPQSGEALKDAVVAGKLPVSNIAPGPIGYTGSASLPRGVWFESPFGPKVQMKICDCQECTPVRLQHYFCVICQGGPYRYTDGLGGRRDHFAPGSTWGVSHVMCSVSCWERYDRSTARRPIPRQPGVQAERHPMVADQEAGAPPERPQVAATSD